MKMKNININMGFCAFLLVTLLLSTGIGRFAYAQETNEAYCADASTDVRIGQLSLLVDEEKVIRLKAEVPEGKTLKAYNISLTYDGTRVSVEEAVASTGSAFPPLNINLNTPGVIVINGFDTTGVEGSAVISFIDVTLRGLSTGSFNFTITVNSFGSRASDQFKPAPDDLLVSVFAGPSPTITQIVPNKGSLLGGTVVTITGANFVDGAVVTFDGAAATNITVDSDTQITCTTSAHPAGEVDVVVTQDSKSDTLPGGYIYVPPVLTISKQATPDPVDLGEDITYTITYGNTGAADAHGVVIIDTVPSNTTYKAASATGGGTYNSDSRQMEWHIDTLAADTSEEVSYMVTVASSGLADQSKITNATYSIDSDETDAVAGAAVETSVNAPVLTISKQAAALIPSGDDLTYTINYANTGHMEATGVVITDTVPANTTFKSATNGGTESGGVITWNIGTVAAGASGSVSFTVNVALGLPDGTSITNANYNINCDQTAAVAGAAVQTTATSAPILNISKVANPSPVVAGADLTYTITYGNTGNENATNVVISDTVPANTTFKSATDNGNFSNGVVTWNNGDLAAKSGDKTVSFTVTVSAALNDGDIISNTTYRIACDQVPAKTGIQVDTVVKKMTLTSTTTSNVLLVGDNKEFNVAGGVGPFTWPHTGNGSVVITDRKLVLTGVALTEFSTPEQTTISVKDEGTGEETPFDSPIIISNPIKVTLAKANRSGAVLFESEDTMYAIVGGDKTTYQVSSSNTAVGDVSNDAGDGTFTAASVGRCEIVVTDVNGLTGKGFITVVSQVNIDKINRQLSDAGLTGEDRILVGQGGSLGFGYSGGSANVAWSIEEWSGSEAGKPVLSGNVLIAKGESGTGKVVLTDVTTGATSERYFEIIAPLALDKDKVIVEIGKPFTLTASGGASGADKGLTLSFTRAGIVTGDSPVISTLIELTADTVGATTLIVADEIGFWAACRIEVVDNITVTPSAISGNVGDEITYTAAGGADVSKYRWYVGDPEQVDNYGKATFVYTLATGDAGLTPVVTVKNLKADVPDLDADIVGTADVNVAKASISGSVNVPGTVTLWKVGDPLTQIGEPTDSPFTFSDLDLGDYYLTAVADGKTGRTPVFALAAGEQKTHVFIQVSDELAINTNISENNWVEDASNGGAEVKLIASGGLSPYNWHIDSGIASWEGTEDNPIEGAEGNELIEVTLVEGETTDADNRIKDIVITLTDNSDPVKQATKIIHVVYPLQTIGGIDEVVKVGDTGVLTQTGGSAPEGHRWSSSDPSVLRVDSSTGNYEALKAGEVLVIVADPNYPDYTNMLGVTVHDDVGITNIEAGEIAKTIQSGKSFVFQASGSDDTYTWKVKDPSDATTTSDIKTKIFKFTAPDLADGGLAGIYEITVTGDQSGFPKTIKVAVPVKVVADTKLIFFAGGAEDTFHAFGAAAFIDWEIVQAAPTALDKTPVADPEAAGAGDIATSNDQGTGDKGTFTPGTVDDITDQVPLRFKVVAANDDQENPQFAGYSLNVYVLPIVKLSVKLSDPDTDISNWEDEQNGKVTLLKVLDEQRNERTGVQEEDGETFSFNLPKITGFANLKYAVMVTANAYVTKVIKKLAAGQTYPISMERKAGSITGNVKSGGVDLQGATVVAYKLGTKEYSNPALTHADGMFSINLKASPTDNTVDGDYRVIATKHGYTKAIVEGIVLQEATGQTDVDQNVYSTLNITIDAKTRLLISKREWDHDSDPYTPMVTDLSFKAEPTAFTNVANLTGPTLVDLLVGQTYTTNFGTLGVNALVGSTIKSDYIPDTMDDLIGIQVQAYSGALNESDLINYTFRVHPDVDEKPRVTQMEPIDADMGGTTGDSDQTAGVDIPVNGVTDPNATGVFIEKTEATASDVETNVMENLQSDIVEIAIVDANGNDLGNVVNPDNPLEITMEFDPTTFDPGNFTIFYRDRQADGSWGPWVDGIVDGTILIISVDLLNNTITFSSKHLSGFGVGSPAPPPEEEEEIEEAVEEEEAPAPAPAAPTTPVPTTAAPIIPAPTTAAPTTTGGGGDGGGCFIATAAYGSAMELHVKVVHEFRDRFLLTNTFDKAFVQLYHTYSSPLAEFIARHSTAQMVVRWSLLPLVGVSWMALDFGPWVTLAVVILLICLICAGAGFTLRRMQFRHQA